MSFLDYGHTFFSADLLGTSQIFLVHSCKGPEPQVWNK